MVNLKYTIYISPYAFFFFLKKYRSQSPPVPVMKNRTQQTLKESNYERQDLISEGNQTELSPRISEPSHFIPYVRTNEIYYLDPDAPLSRPLTKDPQYQNPHSKYSPL